MSSPSTILIIDDDPSVAASLNLLLKRNGFGVLAADGPEAALRILDRESVALVLQDMNFGRSTSGAEGLALFEEIRSQKPSLPVILITAWGSISLAVQGIKAGAADFVTKPWDNAQLLKSIETALALKASEPAEAQSPRSREELDERFDFSHLVGRAPRFLRILEVVGRVSPTDAAVLITGESGTGKELVAEAIHENSRRRQGPFVKVNLGGVSSTLFESEMFGHVKGAFTDARADRRGRFAVADSGTIFLDEIGEIDLSAQVKLLRVLQDRTYEVLGSSVTRTVDTRVVSATNRDLPAMVEAGEFREDLVYRLNLITIHLPALRERSEDIPLLVDHFLGRFAEAYGRATFTVSEAAMGWLRGQRWPGNIRQLKQTLERAVLVLDRERLEVADLRSLAELETRQASSRELSQELPSPGSMTLDEMERAMIERCLKHYQGHLTRAAEALGLSRAALYRRLEKYGLEPQRR